MGSPASRFAIEAEPRAPLGVALPSERGAKIVEIVVPGLVDVRVERAEPL